MKRGAREAQVVPLNIDAFLAKKQRSGNLADFGELESTMMVEAAATYTIDETNVFCGVCSPPADPPLLLMPDRKLDHEQSKTSKTKSYSLYHYFRHTSTNDIHLIRAMDNELVGDNIHVEEREVCPTGGIGENCRNCNLSADEWGSQHCSFCVKLFCSSVTCIRPCDVCSDMFCNSCTTTNYSYEFERMLCIDCDRNVSCCDF